MGTTHRAPQDSRCPAHDSCPESERLHRLKHNIMGHRVRGEQVLWQGRLCHIHTYQCLVYEYVPAPESRE